MGLRNVAQKAAQSGIKAIGDLAVDAKYRSFDSSTMNATTGKPVLRYHDYEDIKVTFANIHQRLVDGEHIRPEDRRVLIAKLDLSPTPKVRDVIERNSDRSTFEVKNVNTDPAEALWDLQVRPVRLSGPTQ